MAKRIIEHLYHEDSYTEECYNDYLDDCKEDLHLDWEKDNVTDYIDWCGTMH